MIDGRYIVVYPLHASSFDRCLAFLIDCANCLLFCNRCFSSVSVVPDGAMCTPSVLCALSGSSWLMVVFLCLMCSCVGIFDGMLCLMRIRLLIVSLSVR